MDPGRGYGCCEQRCVSFRRGIPDLHRDQAIVERFDRTLPKRLSGFHIAREMQLLLARGPLSGWYGCLWLYRMTSLTGKMPSAAVKAKTVAKKPCSLVAGHPVGLEEKSSPRVLLFVLSTTLASSKGYTAGQQNHCVLYRFTG